MAAGDTSGRPILTYGRIFSARVTLDEQSYRASEVRTIAPMIYEVMQLV